MTGPSFSSESFAYDDKLFAGEYPRVTETVTILTGNSVVKGALLGKITASGKYILSLSAAVDGSETPAAIAAEDIDATAADKLGPVYLSGEFNQDGLTYGTAHTAASVKNGLRDLNIYLKTVVEQT